MRSPAGADLPDAFLLAAPDASSVLICMRLPALVISYFRCCFCLCCFAPAAVRQVTTPFLLSNKSWRIITQIHKAGKTPGGGQRESFGIVLQGQQLA